MDLLSNGWIWVVLDEKSLQEYPFNAGAPEVPILSQTQFLLYINDLPDNAIFNIAIYADGTTLYFKFNQVCDWCRKWLVHFNTGKTELDWFSNCGAHNVNGSNLDKKSSFKMSRLSFSFKFNWGSCIVSSAIGDQKIGVFLICSIKCLFSEVALYLYKSTIWSCMEYCCHA